MLDMHKNLIKILAVVLLNLCLLVESARAQDLRLDIQSPNNGNAVYDKAGFVTPFYDPASGTILVSGRIFNVRRSWFKSGNYAVVINGIRPPATVTLSKQNTIIGGVKYTTASFSQRIPLSTYDLWPSRPLLVELVDTRNQEVAIRDRIVIYDMRDFGDATPEGDVNEKIHGFYTQLSDYGLGHVSPDALTGLENAHRGSLPQPGLAEFNLRLTQNARAIPDYDDDDNELNACIDYDDLTEDNFKKVTRFPAFAAAMAEAAAGLIAYRTQKNTVCPELGLGAPACLLEAETYCVKSTPKASDFELCVDQIEGSVDTLRIEDIEDVGLNFQLATDGTEALIRGHSVIAGFHGKVDGKLRSLFVRWKNSICIGRPKANLDDADIETRDWLKNWTACENMQLDSTTASTRTGDTPGIFSLQRGGSDVETINVTLDTAGDFQFSGSTRDAEKGTCSLDFIKDDADEMLVTFREPMRNKLANTWFGNSTNSQQADALTYLFRPLELGKVPLTDMELFASIDEIYSASKQGMTTSWTTSVATTKTSRQIRQKPFYFYHPEGAPLILSQAEDVLGDDFDQSFSVTTALLNRILNVRAADTSLRFKYKPTWAELQPFGVTKPANADDEDFAVLKKKTLKEFDPAFRDAISKDEEVEIEIAPIFDPMVFMHPDPPAQFTIPNVGSPTAYGIDSLEVIFRVKPKGSGKGTNSKAAKTGRQLLRAHVGFLDVDFRLGLNSDPRTQFLVPNMVTDIWNTTIIDSEIKNCPKYLLVNPPVGNCEENLEANISELLEAKLRPVFIDYLSEVPSPQYFDVEGKTDVPVYFDGQSRYQMNQIITYFGQIRP